MKLTKQSNDLISFFSKHQLVNYHKLTATTKQVFGQLYDQMVHTFKETSRIKYTIKQSRTISKPAMHIPSHILSHMRMQDMYREVIYTFTIHHRTIHVHFILEQDQEHDKLDQYVERITLWLGMAHHYAPRECAKKLSIFLYFTSSQKMLPNTNAVVLDEINVNSAFTTSCPKDSEIIVYRREEWFKVFIHETFHNLNLDFSTMDNNIIKQCILTLFNVQSDVNAYEAYTEFWAEILNCLFCSFWMHPNNKESFMKKAEWMINVECSYSMFQMVKVLHHMGLQYNDLYSSSKHSTIKRESQYRENTNVLSYYILKCILLVHYQDYFNSNMNLLFYFTKNDQNMVAFCKFIKKKHKSVEMIKRVHVMGDFYKKQYSTSNKYNKYVFSNLRMSICEME